MRTFIFSALLLAAIPLGAFTDPFLRLNINQRSFINPGGICPNCTGSWFMTAGLRHFGDEWGKTGSTVYYAFGNDARNRIHGPFDVAYMRNVTSVSHISPMAVSGSIFTVTEAYSARYAYAFDIGSWRAGVGARLSYYRMKEAHEIFTVPPAGFHEAWTAQGSQFSADLGTLITDLHGTYFGFSVRNITAPSYALRSESPLPMEGALTRSCQLIAGSKFDIAEKWDVVPEASFQHNGLGGAVEGGAMIRYNHAWGFGASYMSGEQAPHWSIRAGYTRTKFKWLLSFEPSENGPAVETGIVWRFLYPRTSCCININPCDGPPRLDEVHTEFTPHE